MSNTIIKEATLVNEGITLVADVEIINDRINRIEQNISPKANDTVIEAKGRYLLPGMIDDQVHFREPGLTHKGDIASESRAAVSGGITSFMEMPNVNPSTTTIEALEAKFAIANQKSLANYSFYLGATEANIDEIKALNPKNHCGVKVFMGASTGDLLVEHPQVLDSIFEQSPTLIVTHCESSPIIDENLARLQQLKHNITIKDHPIIRDANACYASSSYAVNLAKRFNSQLHVLHITTEKELSLFDAGPTNAKNITAEACVHHLWFSEEDYETKGNLIKCNPAIKAVSDRDALIQAVKSGQIDIIATDHAPHTWKEKQADFLNAPAGLPLVESALLSLLDHVKFGRLTIEQVVEKVCHNPAIRYKVADRGFIREDYFADLVLIDPNQTTLSTHESSRYKCKWTPFNNHTFSNKILTTWVNGKVVYHNDNIIEQPTAAQRLYFNR